LETSDLLIWTVKEKKIDRIHQELNKLITCTRQTDLFTGYVELVKN